MDSGMAAAVMGAGPTMCVCHEGPPLSEGQKWAYIGISAFLVLFCGLMSGLTLGLAGSLDATDIEVLKRSGTPKERKYAERIEVLLKRPHLLLVTLLMCNAVCAEALPIFLDRLLSPVAAIIISVTAVLIFGEIIPQSICSRYGLAVGANVAWLVQALIVLCWVVAYPISSLLDWALGHEEVALFRRPQLKALVDIQAESTTITVQEARIIAGVLDLATKTARQSMTPIEKLFSLPDDARLDEETLRRVLDSGHSRVPIHHRGDKSELVGLLLVKELVLLDPEDCVPVTHVALRPVPYVDANLPMYDMLQIFATGRSHMAALVEPTNDCVRRGMVTPPQPHQQQSGETASCRASATAADTVAASSTFEDHLHAQQAAAQWAQDAATGGNGPSLHCSSLHYSRSVPEATTLTNMIYPPPAPRAPVNSGLQPAARPPMIDSEPEVGEALVAPSDQQRSAGGSGAAAAVAAAAEADSERLRRGYGDQRPNSKRYFKSPSPFLLATPSFERQQQQQQQQAGLDGVFPHTAGAEAAATTVVAGFDPKTTATTVVTGLSPMPGGEVPGALQQLAAPHLAVAATADTAEERAAANITEERVTASSHSDTSPRPRGPKAAAAPSAAQQQQPFGACAGVSPPQPAASWPLPLSPAGSGQVGANGAAGGGASKKPTLLGVITIEDVIEELLQWEILDETDRYVDNLRTTRVVVKDVLRDLPPHLRRVLEDRGVHTRLQRMPSTRGGLLRTTGGGGGGGGNTGGGAGGGGPGRSAAGGLREPLLPKDTVVDLT